MGEEDLYLGREQSAVKHFILRHYLQRFAYIIGSWCPVISYVDCFSGPWNVQSDELTDSSFAIALDELRKAKESLAKRNQNLQIRCFFLEKNSSAYTRLEEFGNKVVDATIETENLSLEESVETILDFVKRGGRGSFPFIFIDPTGWSGFAMDLIRPLLRLQPGEVLINFMTEHIRRFVDSPQELTQETFRRLYGSDEFRERINGLVGQERDDVLVETYAATVKREGGFRYVCTAIVFHPESDRPYFHLIYGTRNARGVAVFKDAEKNAMPFQEAARAKARSHRREQRTGQLDLLSPEELHSSDHYRALRDWYLRKSRNALVDLLREKGSVPYEDAWDLVLTQPLTWESDLKEWISTWKHDGNVSIERMKPRQKVPKRDMDNLLVWRT